MKRFLNRPKRAGLVGVNLLAALLFGAACDQTGTPGNSNDNAAGNENGGGGGSGSLSEEEQAAVDLVMVQLEAMAATASGMTELFNSASFNPEDGDAEFGECPHVTAHREGTSGSIILDFSEEGCSGGALGDTTAKGTITLEYSIDNAPQVTVAATFDMFSVEGTSIDGEVSGEATLSASGSAISATFSLDTSNGSIGGQVTISGGGETEGITIPEGQVTFVNNQGTGYVVTLEGIVINPSQNGNIIPSSGTVAISAVEDDLEITVTFTADSPQTGVVLVSVGGLPAVEYQAFDVDTSGEE